MLELSTQKRILIEAADLIKKQGFYGLSLQDLADRLTIRKPSLYAHFDSKEALGIAVLKRAQIDFKKWADEVQHLPRAEKWGAFLASFESELGLSRVSILAALSLEAPRLPEALQSEVRELYAHYLSWIRSEAPEQYAGSAESVLSSLMGAQLSSRLLGTSKFAFETLL